MNASGPQNPPNQPEETPSRRSNRPPAPQAIGDIVPGHPPVPVTTWYVPAAPEDCTLSIPMAQRLVGNFTHPWELIVDLTRGPQLVTVAKAAGRRYRRQNPQRFATGRRSAAALVVTGWPLDGMRAVELMAGCCGRLAFGCCVAVVLVDAEITVHQLLIRAARAAGLAYLQHIVAAHELPDHREGLLEDGTHLRVHTDVLIFSRPLFPVEPKHA